MTLFVITAHLKVQYLLIHKMRKRARTVLQSSLTILEGKVQKYQIGDVLVTWKGNKIFFKKNRCIDLFSNNTKTDDHEIIGFDIKLVDLKKHCTGELLQKNGLIELYQTDRGLFLVHHWTTCRFAFGFYVEDLEKGDIVPCYVNPYAENINSMSITRFITGSGLHSKLLQKGALVFHSSYIDWDGEAILFAGPSGTGKSTQADLWKEYANADIINGDRALLRKKDDIWHAYGYPCCGSSDICKNRTLPLKAIVILEKGEKNEVHELTMGQKYRALFTGSEMYLWYEKEMELVNKLVEEIIKDVRVLKLVCRPDEDAVEVLKTVLEENNE